MEKTELMWEKSANRSQSQDHTDVKIISKTLKISYNGHVPGMSRKIKSLSKQIEDVKN